MRRDGRIRISIATLIALAATVSSADPPPIATGPEVGTPIPPFSVPDRTGQLRTFEDLRGENGLLLLFHRSADW